MAALMKRVRQKERTFQDCYRAELEALEIAYNRFNNICPHELEPELLDAAMLELKAAELKLEVAARQAKTAACYASAAEPAEEKKENQVTGRLGAVYGGLVESLSSAFKSVFAALPWFQKTGPE